MPLSLTTPQPSTNIDKILSQLSSISQNPITSKRLGTPPNAALELFARYDAKYEPTINPDNFNRYKLYLVVWASTKVDNPFIMKRYVIHNKWLSKINAPTIQQDLKKLLVFQISFESKDTFCAEFVADIENIYSRSFPTKIKSDFGYLQGLFNDFCTMTSSVWQSMPHIDEKTSYSLYFVNTLPFITNNPTVSKEIISNLFNIRQISRQRHRPDTLLENISKNMPITDEYIRQRYNSAEQILIMYVNIQIIMLLLSLQNSNVL